MTLVRDLSRRRATLCAQVARRTAESFLRYAELTDFDLEIFDTIKNQVAWDLDLEEQLKEELGQQR